jgi:hypothetical protein
MTTARARQLKEGCSSRKRAWQVLESLRMIAISFEEV